MPSKTPAQAKLMRAVAHGWKPDRMKGPPVKVAKEFVAADKKAKGYAFGGLKNVKKALKRMQAQQEEKRADAAAITRPWEEGEGPLYDEYLLDQQEGGRRGLIGPRTVGAAPMDPSRYKIHLNPVGPDFEGEVDTSGYWGHALDAARIAELEEQGYTAMTGRNYGYWTPPTGRAWDPTTFQGGLAEATAPPEELERTIDPVPGREFISGDAPAAPARRAAADIAPGFQPGRVPPSLLRYLEKSRAAVGEPVKMQQGGAMNFLFRGNQPMPQVPGGGFTGGGFGGRGPGQFLTEGRVPGGGGGGGAGGQMGRTMRQAIQQMKQRGQRPGGGGGQGQPRPQPQPAPGGGGPAQPGPGGLPPGFSIPKFGEGPARGPGDQIMTSDMGMRAGQMKGIGRAPGAGVPLRGVGRPPGMGGPGAGGGQGMMRPAVMPGRQFMPGGGGAGMPGGANRIGMADQQGALARATQVQTGRPPISRRQPFPGRGGPGGGFGRSRRRGRGRMRR